ncbi:competence type IV pilus minor pilin ComGD [Staphylococcus argenteus]|uniref:competence type IV pilus minor pilin ComGD n=1 Tax=Staphylococcus argenteus TaxID=985002 RepID=UPI000931419B|nr:competence type IV pilus minor pilin ComGD [Staphylococcus argenteus]MBE2124018.1 type II secretion system protein [Staphylococcus argenteus]MBE2131776.1 type II secretion system protein [Staphylococcus argenteus]MBE2140308.1 type II secretion system protein [Staphylococcus argenteus]MCG6475966.1 type II secretion system GspH family protein [Staphylococcus argenteus]MCG9802961.1 type II secretion system GspH family protein [Staphylococcus argenteus]
MEKLLQIRKQQAFTLIEMVVVMMIVSCFLLLTMTSNSLKDFKVINDESNIISLITELNYIKSKAIANQSFINVRFYENSDTIKVVEKNKIYYLKLKVGKIINVAKVDSIYFDKHGNINKFGSISIEKNNKVYRIIFHIEKGRIRYEKL